MIFARGISATSLACFPPPPPFGGKFAWWFLRGAFRPPVWPAFHVPNWLTASLPPFLPFSPLTSLHHNLHLFSVQFKFKFSRLPATQPAWLSPFIKVPSTIDFIVAWSLFAISNVCVQASWKNLLLSLLQDVVISLFFFISHAEKSTPMCFFVVECVCMWVRM